MENLYYKKVGNKFVPVTVYDNQFERSFPQGHHLIVVDKSWTTRVSSIDPDFAALKAASLSMKDKLVSSLMEASKMRVNKKLTQRQHDAWKNLEKEMGDTSYLEYPSMVEIAEKFLTAIEDETKKVITNPAVKLAYEQFDLMYKLTKNKELQNE